MAFLRHFLRSTQCWVAPAAIGCGGLITLSLAPFNFWPAAVVSLLGLLQLLQTNSLRQAFWRGWLFGAGLFGSGVSWVYVSIHDHGHASIPLAILMTAVFCAGLALLPAIFAGLWVRWLRPLRGGTLLGFPALWVLFEWLRNWLLTGFPWLYLGNGHLETWLAGWVPVVGVFGISLLVALTASTVYAVYIEPKQSKLIAGLLGLSAAWIGGLAIKEVDWTHNTGTASLSVALVQPNIPLSVKWNPDAYPGIVARYRRATEEAATVDLILWPEAALPRLFQYARGVLEPFDERLRSEGRALITGIPWRDNSEKKYFNSIVSLGNGNGVYHKQHLVPFGEYVPLEHYLRGLIEFFDLPMSNLSPGPADQGNLVALGYEFAPFICYEIVYPDLVANTAWKADAMITISNDSWFGTSIGPLQHMEIAQMRALENGRFLLRATNNGVTAIIDHHGKVVDDLPQFTQGVLKGDVEIMAGRTPFSYFGSTPVLLTCFFLLLAIYRGNRQR